MRNRLEAPQARAILEAAGVDLGADFHALPSAQVDALREAADARRYRAPRARNGSRVRYWHAYLVRVASRPGR